MYFSAVVFYTLLEELFPDFWVQWSPKEVIWGVIFDTLWGSAVPVKLVFLAVFFYVSEGWRGQESKKFQNFSKTAH